MKIKAILGVLATAVLAVSAPVSAAPLPQTISTTLKANMLHPPMDVTVINASSYYIYAIIPGTDIDDMPIAPSVNQHFYGYDSNVRYLNIMLENANHVLIYPLTSVCREAIITVFDTVIKTDTDLCQ